MEEDTESLLVDVVMSGVAWAKFKSRFGDLRVDAWSLRCGSKSKETVIQEVYTMEDYTGCLLEDVTLSACDLD